MRNIIVKLLSVNVALPKLVEIDGKNVFTGIYKTPVKGRVWLTRLTLVGDGQADAGVHGGEHQAAYCYPFEHYAYWQNRLNLINLPHGTFGENFTISGLLEEDICIGDILQIGDAKTGVKVQVTMPRIPCFKFGDKIGFPDILDEFLRSGKSGFYLRVIQTGEVVAGDSITILERDPQAINIRTTLGMQKLDEGDAELLKRALTVTSLTPLLRQIFEQRLASKV
ncbi:MOSC domain-containing protein [Methylotenera versatilis]|uniref:MOSC domain-containing protein n=1 Tax=Methylotenera versatilis TaxID=1055487 RepID=UPI001E5E7E48|nr:MOSC domain-containing protein [Methylotenera versatilis]